LQKIGLEGANTLAEVLRVNKTLQEIRCEYSGIPLQGFMNMISALRHNTSILYLPQMIQSREQCLDQAKAEVKAIKDEQQASLRSHRRSMPMGVSLGLPSKFGAMIRSPKRPKAVSKEMTKQSHPTLSEQDVGAALRLVDQNWERQAYRLSQYLSRNYALAGGYTVPMEIEEEDFERTSVDADLIKLLEDANFDQTPTLELSDPLAKAASQGSNKGNSTHKTSSNPDTSKKTSSNDIAARIKYTLPPLSALGKE
jgi:hypothetical protein